MQNLNMAYPFTSLTGQNDIIPALRNYIEALPLFDGCCITSTESPYYESGDYVTNEHNDLSYKFNKYGYNINVNPFHTYYGNARATWVLKDRAVNKSVWEIPMEIKIANSTDLAYYYRISPVQIITLNSPTTNGFWLYYHEAPYNSSAKIILTKCIDENDDTETYAPIVAMYAGRLSTNTFCKVYTIDTSFVDIKAFKNDNSGYSPGYLLRQLRIGSLLYPDVYIISGGYEPIDQDIITIDNNAYAHLANDVFIKIN